LEEELNLQTDASKDELLKAMGEIVIENLELIKKYKKIILA